jgi:hypothetical protein
MRVCLTEKREGGILGQKTLSVWHFRISHSKNLSYLSFPMKSLFVILVVVVLYFFSFKVSGLTYIATFYPLEQKTQISFFFFVDMIIFKSGIDFFFHAVPLKEVTL